MKPTSRTRGNGRIPLSPEGIRAVEEDAAYFIDHPDAMVRVRPFVAGEFHDADGKQHLPAPGNGLVLVMRLSAAQPFRLRWPADLPLPRQYQIMAQALGITLDQIG